MRTTGSEVESCPSGGKPERIGFWAPASIVAFIALTLVGTYYVRLGILEKTMIAAMEIGDNATVWELANSFPSPVNARDRDGRTPLHRAAEWGNRALVALLLAKGADVNAKTSAGWGGPAFGGRTPLHVAAIWGRDDVAELLIAKGANIGARNNEGETPLHSAAFEGQKKVAALLISKGADVNARNIGGGTPLHETAFSGQQEVAQLLIANGADINAKNTAGKTALELAIYRMNYGFAGWLNDAGAKE